MEQAQTTKEKTGDSTKEPLILRECGADGNSHMPTESLSVTTRTR